MQSREKNGSDEDADSIIFTDGKSFARFSDLAKRLLEVKANELKNEETKWKADRKQTE